MVEYFDIHLGGEVFHYFVGYFTLMFWDTSELWIVPSWVLFQGFYISLDLSEADIMSLYVSPNIL